MKLIYSKQAVSDLEEIAAYYVAHASQDTAEAIGSKLRNVAARLAAAPYSAPRLARRSHIRVASVVRYPFRVFYRILNDEIEIVHIRHTARRPPRFG